jgi:hypothetical protein
VALRGGDARHALERAGVAARLAAEAGHPMMLATCEITRAAAAALGGGAGPPLEEARALADRVGFAYGAMGARVLLAAQALAAGDDDGAAARLAEVLPRLRRTGCRYLVWLGRREMAELLALALERGIEPGLAREIVAARALAPGPRAHTVPDWPWRIRIEALGGLEVALGGAPLEPRKAQRKPLELLKALVARGPKGARMDALAAALWPHGEGDTAHHALETTAYRLRRLLGDNAALVLRSGRLALDPARVFVDAWAFEALVARAGALHAAGDAAGAARVAARARALYRGELLEDDEHPLVAEARSRLATQLRRLPAPRD